MGIVTPSHLAVPASVSSVSHHTFRLVKFCCILLTTKVSTHLDVVLLSLVVHSQKFFSFHFKLFAPSLSLFSDVTSFSLIFSLSDMAPPSLFDELWSFFAVSEDDQIYVDTETPFDFVRRKDGKPLDEEVIFVPRKCSTIPSDFPTLSRTSILFSNSEASSPLSRPWRASQ